MEGTFRLFASLADALLFTHRGDRLDFEPAQDAGQLVGRGVGGPLDPHVLQQEERVGGWGGGLAADGSRPPCMMIKDDYDDEDEGDRRQESMFIEVRQSC